MLCLANAAEGRAFSLHAKRPGAELNARVDSSVLGPAANVPAGAILTRVDIMGPLEQRAGYQDVCEGYSDGHDAVAERLTAAFEDGDVLLVIDSPGGAAAGIGEAVRSAMAAKAAHGRRVTAYVNEQCASAAMWWAACLADEIFLPPEGQIGSIGARSGHMSVAGALAQDGVAVEFFTWPNAGKVAFAPELPLSELGRARGQRDVNIIGEAFASAVAAARPALTLDAIVALSADMLTGTAAVAAGLADGVASLDDTIAYALTLAAAPAASPTDTETDPAQTRATRTRTMTTAARLEDPPADDKKDPEADDGMRPTPDCAACGMRNQVNAKFCDQCGASMAAKPTAEGDGDGDSPEDEAAAPPAGPPPADKKPVPPPADASVAALLGLQDNASPLAIRTAVIGWSRERAAFCAATETTSVPAAIGAAKAHASDAKRMAEVETEVRGLRKSAEYAERLALLGKLESAKIPGCTTGDLFSFVDDSGKPLADGKRRPAKLYAGLPIAELRGHVDAKLANAPKPAAPYQPDPALARAVQDPARTGGAHEPTLGQIEAAKKHPAVIAASLRAGALPIDTIARAHVTSFGA